MSTLLIQGGLLVDTEWTRHADILVKGSKIAHIASKIDEKTVPEGTEIVHADGLCILPGLIDSHTHFGLETKNATTVDSFKEGSKLAAFGGVTTVVDFAQESKNGNLCSCAKNRISQMQKGMAIDFSLHQSVVDYREGIEKEFTELKKCGVNTIKFFTTYKNVDSMIENPEGMKKLLLECKKLGMMVTIHCKDDVAVQTLADKWSQHEDTSRKEAQSIEALGIQSVGKLALEVGITLYIVHLSTKAGLEAVRELRMNGLSVIVETSPQYLFLDDTLLEGKDGPLYLTTPPLRKKEDKLALQDALSNGEIQIVSSGHCAFSQDQKMKSAPSGNPLSGIPGCEELLPLIHTFALDFGTLGISQVVNMLSTSPAKAFGLYPNKGSLRVGTDADIVLFNPDESWKIGLNSIHSASAFSAYNGKTVTGKVVMTYLRGRLIMSDEVYLGIEGDGIFIPQDHSIYEGKRWN